MIRVYVAGAITPTGKGNHALEFLENIKQGIRASIRLIQYDFAPFCPMLDFQYFLCLYPNEAIPPEKIYAVSIAMMLGCDAILILPGANKSKGWKKERKVAEYKGIPIFISIGALRAARDSGEIRCRLLPTQLGT